MDLTNLNKDKKQRRKGTLDLGNMVYGKVPPQAKDIEEAILGAILLHKNAFDEAASLLRPDAFYVESHGLIFKAMQRLAVKSQPIDHLTVSEELRSNEELELIGGSYYLHKLTNCVVSAAHMTSHCRIVLQKYIQREIIRVSGELIGSAYEDMCDPFELLSEAFESLSEVTQNVGQSEMAPMSAAIVETLQMIEKARGNTTAVTGVASGFSELDRATRGWQPADLIILAARPSVGKTAFALQVVRNAAQSFSEVTTGKKKSVGMWSLEMKKQYLVLRMLAAESRELLHKIQTGRLDDEAMKRIYSLGVKPLARLNIFFDDRPGLNLQILRAQARRMKQKYNLGLIVVDYLQLMTPAEKSGNREQEVSKISRGLKLLAMELEVPIIALSQMSREFEKRTGVHRKPQLSDLRESGSLEQDADLVMFLWEPSDADIEANPEMLTRRHLRIAKQRNGLLISMDLDFKNEIQLFEEIEKIPTLGGQLSGNWRPVADLPAPKNYYEPDSKSDDDGPF